MSVTRSHHRFSVADYEEMIDLGILTENHRVELIRGQVLEKMTSNGNGKGSPASTWPEYYQFSVAEYEQMVDAGILTENDRVELIRGEIVEKRSIGELHAACVKRINRFFAARFGERVCIGIQDPIRLAESEPEPDVSLLKPRSDDYAKSHPKPDEVLLLVEVADASLEFDRSIKSGVYAQNGIAEYWIVNLINRKLEVRRCPQPNGKYAEVQSLSIQDTVNLSAFPAIPFQVSELFPPAE